MLNMGDPARIVDLAEDLIRLSGFTAGQIPIEVTGMRAGEKLHEAFWEVGAVVEATAHSVIRRVREREHWQSLELPGAVKALEAATRCGIGAARRRSCPSGCPPSPRRSPWPSPIPPPARSRPSRSNPPAAPPAAILLDTAAQPTAESLRSLFERTGFLVFSTTYGRSL